MFEGAKLIDIGALMDDPIGALGFQLMLSDERIITVTGLTINECRDLARLLGEQVELSLRAQ